MGEPAGTHVVVYRGLEARAVDMVEDMLASEGLSPRRQGRTDPSHVGVGMYALEQRLEVPVEHAESARELIAAYQRGVDAEQSAALDAEALRASPLAEAPSNSVLGSRPVMLLVLIFIVLGLVWLAERL